MKQYKIFIGFLLCFVFAVAVISAVSEMGAYYIPDYEQKDISNVMKDGITEGEYLILREQTGLSKMAVDEILEEKDAKEILKDYQKQNFKKYNISCNYLFFPITKEEQIDENSNLKLPTLKDGDILLTKSTHTLLFRHGHVGIVINADSGEILEAVCLGTSSVYNDISNWQKYPSMVVLRPKNLSDEEIKRVVDYAKYNLFDVKYSFAADFYDNSEDIKRTHCSHLVWKAYDSIGMNIDSNGGLFVLPDDILKSDKLEIIWSYGINTKK